MIYSFFFLISSSLSASNLTMSSSSSRGSLASSRGSLASSRGSLSSISFTDIYGLPQYDRTAEVQELADPHLRYLLPLEAPVGAVGMGVGGGGGSYGSDMLSLGKTKRSHDNTPQSLASLSSRSSLSSLSPPSSPMDTPYHSATQDCPLTQMTEEYMELASRGILESLRAPGPSQGQIPQHPALLPSSTAEAEVPTAHLLEAKTHREGGPQGSFPPTGESKAESYLWLSSEFKTRLP